MCGRLHNWGCNRRDLACARYYGVADRSALGIQLGRFRRSDRSVECCLPQMQRSDGLKHATVIGSPGPVEVTDAITGDALFAMVAMFSEFAMLPVWGAQSDSMPSSHSLDSDAG
jgi:hypothetical protein